jgi:electron-transferring-flavoprotein dehydrogenase
MTVDGAACPIKQRVTEDKTFFLTKGGGAWSLPVPPTMENKDKNFVISLSGLTRWLGQYAEQEHGVDIFPGFAASEVLYHQDG